MLRSVEAARASHPGISINYAWPVNVDLIGTLFAEHLSGYEAGGEVAEKAVGAGVQVESLVESHGHNYGQ